MRKGRSGWIQRQQSDKYYKKSKHEGHRARSYYKLEQIDKKYQIINLSRRSPPKILDFGAAPGAWLEYIKNKFNERWESDHISQKRVCGIDLNSIRPFDDAPYIYTVRIDIFKDKCREFLNDNGPFDIIISDLAPKTAGDDRDIAIQSDMLRKLYEYLEFLKPGGKFVCKVFQSSESYELFQMFASRFHRMQRMKPQASREQSRELYFVGLQFKN